MSEQLDIAIDSIEHILDSESRSKDDPLRKELLWEPREEIFLKNIVNACEKQSKLHRSKGKLFKKLYAGFGVPSMLIPIVLSGLTDQLKDHPLLHSLLMIGTGVISGISAFFNFGQKYQEYFEYENKYAGLASDIATELCKPKRHRVACDLYLERIRLIYGGLNTNAPDVDETTHTDL